jgi:hypothetical protein
MIEELNKYNILYTPWPTYINEQFFDGQIVKLVNICKKCAINQCKSLTTGNNEGICRNGIFYKTNEVDGNYIIVFGVVVDKSTLPKYPYLRDILKKIYVEKRQVIEWFSNVRNFIEYSKDRDLQIVRKSLHPFHDTNRLAREIRNISEEYISRNGSGTFVERLKGSQPDIKTIYKASMLLLDTFDSANIYFNPESSKYGKPKPIEIYKLLDKLVYVLNMAQLNNDRIRITFNGNCHRSYNLYESFKLIPLSLLQNAIKYSSDGKVTMSIFDSSANYSFFVESVGPLIEKEEIAIIFKKEVRGKWAQMKTNDGLGVGLYIADMVASAHGIKIICTSTGLGYERDNIPQASNKFVFNLPSVGEIL